VIATEFGAQALLAAIELLDGAKLSRLITSTRRCCAEFSERLLTESLLSPMAACRRPRTNSSSTATKEITTTAAMAIPAVALLLEGAVGAELWRSPTDAALAAMTVRKTYCLGAAVYMFKLTGRLLRPPWLGLEGATPTDGGRVSAPLEVKSVKAKISRLLAVTAMARVSAKVCQATHAVTLQAGVNKQVLLDSTQPLQLVVMG